MKTIITAIANDETAMVDLSAESDCPHILRMFWTLKSVCPYTEVEGAMNETEVYKLASETLPHAACPVPCGIVKAVEVAGGLGIKKDVSIKIE